MKVYCISDLHLSINCDKPMDIFGPVWDNYLDKIEADWAKKVKDDDVVLIPGDISWAMKLKDAIDDLNYIGKFNGFKILLRGNHDYWWSSVSELRNNLPEKMFAVQNDAVKIGNFVFCGSRGWVVPEVAHKTKEDEKIYNRELIRLELSLKSAKNLMTENDTLICMMHYPPFNSRCEDSGFTDLMEKYGVNKVVFGHLHSYDKKQKLVINKNGITYYLCSCDLVNNNLVEIV